MVGVQEHPLHLELLTSGEQLQEFAPQWQELLRSDPRATPFQSPAWLIPWWRHIGQGELLSLAVCDRAPRRLYALRIDRQIVATLYDLLGKPGPERRFYYYLAGFNPELDKLSPGTLLLGHAMEQAISEGCRVFDFLAGQEPYKYRWGAVDTKLRRRCLRHGGHAKARSTMT